MVQCKNCKSSKLTKCGKVNGVQRFKCKECGIKFSYQTTSESIKIEKQTINECIEKYLLDPTLKQGMMKLQAFLKEIKLNIIWYHKISFKCNYKGKRVLYINFGNTDWLRIRVCTVSDMHGIGDMDLYMEMLTNELKTEFNNYLNNFIPCKVCKGCGGICERRRSYYITNPTEEQFYWINKFIIARKDFIDKN